MDMQTMASTISERIDSWAIKTPDQTCYEYKGESLSYKNLKINSDALATYLISQLKARRQQPILVYGHMDPLMVVSFLGVIKNGSPYIPVDESMPVERIKQIISLADPACILATEDWPNALHDVPVPMIEREQLSTIINEHKEQVPDPQLAVRGNENHYIIYTSGSTGLPKGVQISQQNLISFTGWLLQDFSFTKGMRILNQAPYSFDLSVMDLYPSLLSGGTLLPLDKSTSSNLKDLYQTIPRLALDVWVSTPSFADICLLDPNFNQENNPSLVKFLFCGEVLTKETARELIKRFPKATIYNTYGPTEATVAVTQLVVTEEIINQYPSLPLGAAKPDTQLVIRDEESGENLPDGEKGEIVLIGPSVSKGYLNEPEKTAKVFKREGDFNAYYTGDSGVIKDGHLFFQGRLDFQIKLHGYRIELEDIENNLKEVSYIKNAIVVPKLREGKVDNLVAFVIPNDHSFEKEYQLSSAIKKELAEVMPSYMIPRKWVYKSEFPLTMNGKVDRKSFHHEVNE